MKYIITESQYNNTIDKFITYMFEPHEEKRSKKSPDSIFWVKDGEVISDIKKSGYFWIHPQIWKNIMNILSLDYNETQQVIKDWLEEHYKLGGLTPLLVPLPALAKLEEHYKLGGLTPLYLLQKREETLEEHYKLGGLTPYAPFT